MAPLLKEDEFPSSTDLMLFALIARVIFLMSLVIVVFTVFVMFRTPDKCLRVYRYYLTNELCWGLATDFVFCTFTPLFLLPLPCAAIRYDLGDLAGPLLFMFLASAAGRVLAIFNQSAYRFFQSLPFHSPLQRFRWDTASGTTNALAFTAAVAIFTAIMAIPTMYGMQDMRVHKAIILAADPHLEVIFQRFPHMICVSTTVVLPFQVVIGFVMVGVLFLSSYMLLMLVMYWNLRRHSRNSRTYRLQIMLFGSLIAQTVAALLCLSLPSMIMVMSPWLGLRNAPRLSILLSFMITSHLFIDCVMILVLIKPYRRSLFSGNRKSRSLIETLSSVPQRFD